MKTCNSMIIMGANAAGIAGSQVFRTQDAPLYMNAFTACLTLSAFVLLQIVGQSLWYYFSNKKLESEDVPAPVVTGKHQTANGSDEELAKRWWWTW
jgi:hypothetical protein